MFPLPGNGRAGRRRPRADAAQSASAKRSSRASRARMALGAFVGGFSPRKRSHVAYGSTNLLRYDDWRLFMYGLEGPKYLLRRSGDPSAWIHQSPNAGNLPETMWVELAKSWLLSLSKKRWFTWLNAMPGSIFMVFPSAPVQLDHQDAHMAKSRPAKCREEQMPVHVSSREHRRKRAHR